LDVSVEIVVVSSQAAASLACLNRSFLREGNRTRHRCDSVRSRMLLQRSTTIESSVIDEDGVERGRGINGGGGSADGNGHVRSLEQHVDKVAIGRGDGKDGRDGVTGGERE